MTAQSSSASSAPQAEPRWATPRSPGRKTIGFQVAAICARIGLPLMGWQRLAADVGGELVEDPSTGLLIPAYREVVVTVPRQSGKTTLVLGWELQRAIGWESRQSIAYSAQDGGSARRKLLDDQVPLLERHRKALHVSRIRRANDNTGVVFANGSRIEVLASSAEAGHGKTIDLGVKDEFFADYDDRRDQALIPAMSTRPAAQVLTTSTMGTDESVPLNRVVDRGRLAASAGQRHGIAYFEWSADPAADPDDPAVWWSCMPALGHTIGEPVVAHARASLTDGEFRRAFLNQQTKSDERVLPAVAWDAIGSDTAEPAAPLTFALDVNPERSAGAIVAASGGTHPTAALLDYRSSIGWLPGRAVEIDRLRGPRPWLVDTTGPAASLIPELERAGLNVVPVSARELIDACGQFYDGVMEHTIVIRRDRHLDDAAAGAAKRSIGDSWAWTRKSAAADISPLVATTLALWGSRQPPEADSEPFMVVT